jgi:peptide methionine sulfoxide reductase MsrB
MSNANYNALTAEERYVIEDKGTERPFAGEYDDFYQEGAYLCRRCDAELYRSVDKFDARCGWPAFDKDVPGRGFHAHERTPLRQLAIHAVRPRR